MRARGRTQPDGNSPKASSPPRWSKWSTTRERPRALWSRWAGGQAGGQARERAGGHAGHGQARAVRGQNASDNGRAALELDGWVARESEHEVAGVLLVQAGSRGATQSAAALSIHAVAAVPPRDIEMLAQELSQGGRCRLHIVHKDKTVPVRDDDVDGVVLLHAKPKILL